MRPVPEPAGTSAALGVAEGFGEAEGCAPADAEAFGRFAADAVGCGPCSACVVRKTTAAIAPVVRPVTQTQEGSRRAGTGTHLLSYGTPPVGARSSYCEGPAPRSLNSP